MLKYQDLHDRRSGSRRTSRSRWTPDLGCLATALYVAVDRHAEGTGPELCPWRPRVRIAPADKQAPSCSHWQSCQGHVFGFDKKLRWVPHAPHPAAPPSVTLACGSGPATTSGSAESAAPQLRALDPGVRPGHWPVGPTMLADQLDSRLCRRSGPPPGARHWPGRRTRLLHQATPAFLWGSGYHLVGHPPGPAGHVSRFANPRGQTSTTSPHQPLKPTHAADGHGPARP